MLTVLIDPEKLGTAPAFAEEAAAFVDWVKRSPPGEGVERVRIAGDPERETRARREREGIAVDATTWNEIGAAAESLGKARAEIDALARGV